VESGSGKGGDSSHAVSEGGTNGGFDRVSLVVCEKAKLKCEVFAYEQSSDDSDFTGWSKGERL
jgi:hypothetical protein